MKTIILSLVIFLFVFPYFSHAQSDSQDVATANTTGDVGSQVAALSNSVDAMNSKLGRLLSNDSTEFLVVDSSALEEAKSNPGSLYNDAIGFSGRHKNSGWVWLRFCVSMFLLGSIWFFGFKYCITTSLCRDAAYDANGNLTPVTTRPFSYSRMQLFWWTMIILSCYTFFYGLTGALAPLNPTSVLLLGFGVLVLAGGKIIDQRQMKMTPAGSRNQDTDATQQSFLNDILSDDHGPSIHRFQAVVFNIVFGIGYVSYFITSIYTKRYPLIDFSEWQFAMIGISSATYLGMKATENTTPQVADQASVQAIPAVQPVSFTSTATMISPDPSGQAANVADVPK